MTNSKALFAAVALIAGVAAATLQPKSAEALPRIQLDTQIVQAASITKIGYKRRVRRHIWRHHRRGHWRGYGRPYANGKCHRHVYEAPGMHMHPRVRCGHTHFRAYRSWF